MEKQKSLLLLSKIGMFLLASYPILYYYALLLPFSWGEILLFLFSCYVIITRPHGRKVLYPKYFLLFWVYCAIVAFIHTPLVSLLIPGGPNMFMWAISLGALIPLFDYNLFHKYYRAIFLFAAGLFILQEVTSLLSGDRFFFHLPISDETANYGNLSFAALENVQRYAERSSSLFMEPSYFGQYSLILLMMELFSPNTDNKKIGFSSFFIVFILIFLRSGVGMLGLVLLSAIKIFDMYKHRRNYLIISFLLLLPLLFFATQLYIDSDIGSNMIKRESELTDQHGSGYIRSIRGYLYYNEMPILGKLVGADLEEVRTYKIIDDIWDLGENQMIFNGIQSVLITKGIIGLLLFFLIYASLYKKSTLFTKTSLWLLFLFFLLEACYMTPNMMILTVLAVCMASNSSIYNYVTKL